MKKIISTILAVTISIFCADVNVFAQSRALDINTALTSDEIHILYNDTVVQYEDVKPVNTEGRVMIPFRAALENMGAAVDYDDATRTVTAVKGDTTITFVLLDDTIYINAAGVESTITMDVPMIIVSDRTLVPIRFMSNALGMQVGWDGDSETVIIMDYDEYMDELQKIAPNLELLSSIEGSVFNKTSITFDMSYITKDGEKDTSASVSGSAETLTTDGSRSVNGVLTLKTAKLSADKLTVEALTDGSTLYIKSDTIKKLAASSDDAALKAAALLLGSEEWYSVDIVRLLAGLGISSDTLSMLSTAIAPGSSPDIEELIMSMITTEGDAVFGDAMKLASMFDMYEAMDRYISVSIDEDGAYAVSLNITPEQFAEIINISLGSYMDESSKAALLAGLSCSVKADIKGDGSGQSSSVGLELKTGSLALNYDFAGTSEKAEAAEITIPANSSDITDILITLLR